MVSPGSFRAALRESVYWWERQRKGVDRSGAGPMQPTLSMRRYLIFRIDKILAGRRVSLGS
jgi:hypothetical protein